MASKNVPKGRWYIVEGVRDVLGELEKGLDFSERTPTHCYRRHLLV